MSYFVIEIKDNEGMDDFLSIPSEIYHNDPNWIAPLRSELKRVLNPSENPYFKDAILNIFVCYYNGKPLARSILVINKLYWQKSNRKSAFFGFFESFNDNKAVNVLFENIEARAKSEGAEYLEGPFNPNHYSELGIQTDNFSSAPVFFETYNPSYYRDMLITTGYSESNEFHTMINHDISSTVRNKYRTPSGESHKNDITVRKLNIFRLRRDLEILRDINNDAFENNPYFIPLSYKEYRFTAKYMFLACSPGMILIAEHKGKPVGAVQFVLNFNTLIKSFDGKVRPWDFVQLLRRRRALKELVVFTVGVKKAYRRTRVFAMLLKSSLNVFRNYSTLTTTWISDENLSNNLTRLLELKPYKHFSIFSKQL